MYTLPTTKFPLVHDDFRLAFLYPVNMMGFAIPLIPDMTAKTAPYVSGQMCVVRNRDLASIENRICHFRGRVLTIPISEFKEVYPEADDNDYDNLLRSGALNVLFIGDDDTHIEYEEDSTYKEIIGSHFMEVHWENPDVLKSQDQEFAVVLNDAINVICHENNFDTPSYSYEQVKGINTWIAPGYSISRPSGVPYVHLQMNTDLNYSDVSRRVEEEFNIFSGGIISAINEHYGIVEKKKDVNAINNYEPSQYTVLQSTAARSIQDPVLKVARSWLSKQ